MGGFDRMDDLNRDGELSTFERETRDYNRYLELSGDNTMDDNSFISAGSSSGLHSSRDIRNLSSVDHRKGSGAGEFYLKALLWIVVINLVAIIPAIGIPLLLIAVIAWVKSIW